MFILKNNPSLRIVRQMRRGFGTWCTNSYTSGKTPSRCPLDASTGRSMVEMLGVLAIIGVLSIGAIAGYSKAMMKYKLHKHAEQLNTILSAVQQYRHEWKFTSNTQLKPYYQKMGIIPPEMIKDNTDNIYDIFNNTILLMTNGKASNLPYTRSVGFAYSINSNNYDVCLNFFIVVKAYHEDLLRATINNADSLENSFYGDKYCNLGKRKCIRNINMNEMYNICNFVRSADKYSFWISFPVEDHYLQ